MEWTCLGTGSFKIAIGELELLEVATLGQSPDLEENERRRRQGVSTICRLKCPPGRLPRTDETRNQLSNVLKLHDAAIRIDTH